MAKVYAPLFGFGASGKIGKALVYFTWKGIDVVRSWVIPANPKSADQTTQRGYWTSAVAEWHAAGYTAGDRTAWNMLASVATKVMTGFNRMIKAFVDEIILGNVWERIYAGSTSDVTSASFVAICHKAAGGNAPICYYGTSKTALTSSVTLETGGGDTWQNLIEDLSANTIYYFTFIVGTSEADYGRAGIYSQKTSAA